MIPNTRPTTPLTEALTQAAHTMRDREGSKGQLTLLDRLRKGHTWLTATHGQLLARENLGIGSRLERRFLEALDAWDTMDKLLRELYEFQGCVMGPGSVVLKSRRCHAEGRAVVPEPDGGQEERG